MSSRLFVKNIPKHVTEERLKKHFSQKGTVTDVKILKRNGTSRQIGFIGFKNEEEAKNALDFFNNTYLDTSKLTIELAASKGEVQSRPWSKYSKGSSAYNRLHPEDKPSKKKLDKVASEDEDLSDESKKELAENKRKKAQELQEFLNVMKSRNAKKTWKNDEVTTPLYSDEDSDSDSDDYQDIPEIAESAISHEANEDYQAILRGTNDESGSDSESDEEEAKQVNQPKLSKLSKQPKLSKQANQPEINVGDEDVIEEGRLFIRNLPYSCKEEEIAAHMRQFGELVDVFIPLNAKRESKGYCFATFMFPEQAITAIEKLDKSVFQGRVLSVSVANVKKEEYKKMVRRAHTYKGEKYLNKRLEEVNNTSSWNSMYLNSNTIMEVISSKLGVKTNEILDVESGNMAVRVALAETEVLEDTKQWLEKQGVKIDILDAVAHGKKVKRSDKIILIKNLPYSADKNELSQLFSQYGEIESIVMPESHVMALVTFSVPSEAKRAFNHLSYRKYQHIPLYLEYLPVDLWNGQYEQQERASMKREEPEESGESGESKKPTESTEPKESTDLGESSIETTIGDETDSTTLYIKNLNWKSTEESIRKMFGKVEGLKTVVLPKKKGPAGENLPMGFGFVVYENRQQALKALNRFNDKPLDGHVLQLKFSARKEVVTTKKRKVTNVGEKEKGETRTKLIVRNIPFEASRTELRELFGSFGQLKSLRLPKKFDGTSRGFVFVEYISSDDAKTAIRALGSTHLLGRKLVVEYAKEEKAMDSPNSHISFNE